jgi:hypothetical protein
MSPKLPALKKMPSCPDVAWNSLAMPAAATPAACTS